MTDDFDNLSSDHFSSLIKNLLQAKYLNFLQNDFNKAVQFLIKDKVVKTLHN